MDEEYKKNMSNLLKILDLLENTNPDLETAQKKINKGKTLIKKCLDMLDKSEGNIEIVTMKSGKLSYKEFDE